ncbi:MAG: hypothetical protein NTV32_00155 [Gammaproteobacteria bacterium]|nr:hypothetical protein [Gammaproteobacteria bacterium]
MKKNSAITLLFLVIAIIIQWPLHLYHDTPPMAACPSRDICYHITNILQAKAAFQGGQIWLRTAPDLMQHFLYPIFQFYSPFFYMITGALALGFQDPFSALELALLLISIIGAWYTYALYHFLFKNEFYALLGTALYFCSPYLIQNIDVRNDFTEAFSQCLFPVTLYYWFRLYEAPQWTREKFYFLVAGIASYYALITTHFITLLTGTAFMLFLFAGLSWHQHRFRPLLGIFYCILGSIALSTWYIIPIFFEHALFIISNANYQSPANNAWMAPLSSLLAFKAAASPNVIERLHFPFSPAFGPLVIISAVYWYYQLYIKKINRHFKEAALIQLSLWLFLLSAFIICSPLDLWPLLPRFTEIIQFPYRLLSESMWLGGFLFVGMLTHAFRNRSLTWAPFIASLICIISMGWQWTAGYQDGTHTETTMRTLDPNYPSDYRIWPRLSDIPSHPYQSIAAIQKNCQTQNNQSICHLTIDQTHESIQLPILYYPKLLTISRTLLF